MINKIDFYFDFISPYAYLAHKKIKKIEESSKNLNFVYKPILLGGLHKLAGITAPAFIEQKNNYMIKDCAMVAKKFNINFKFNSKFPISTVNLMRGVLILKDDILKNYIDAFFDAYWEFDINLSEKNEFVKIINKLNLNEENFFKEINNQKIKDDLRNRTDKAFEKKVFGSPTFIVNNKIFWGQDRLEYAIDEFR